MATDVLSAAVAYSLAAATDDQAGAPGPVAHNMMDLFVQQHPCNGEIENIVAELATLAQIDMETASGSFTAQEDAPPLPLEDSMHDGMLVLAEQAGQMSKQGEKKVKRKSVKRSLKEVVEDDSDGEEEGGQSSGKTARIEKDGLSSLQIGQMYAGLLSCATANRYHFTECIKKFAVEFDVSVTSLRNILTFKNRRPDASKYWNDALWKLYNQYCRCVTCRLELRADSNVLCTHFGRGRPSNKKKHVELTATRHRTSSAETLKKKETNNGLQRAYIVQICVTQVWAVLGCCESQQKLLDKTHIESKA